MLNSSLLKRYKLTGTAVGVPSTSMADKHQKFDANHPDGLYTLDLEVSALVHLIRNHKRCHQVSFFVECDDGL